MFCGLYRTLLNRSVLRRGFRRLPLRLFPIMSQPTSALEDLRALKQDVLRIRTVAASSSSSNSSAPAFDASWFPRVPPGHTEYSWPPEEEVKPQKKKSQPNNNKNSNQKKQKQPKQPKQNKSSSTAPSTSDVPDFYRMEIVTGIIMSCEKHPDADSLYIEQIDVGEENPRQIVSGLVKFIPLEEMVGSMVMVIKNLKPSPLRGALSSGMVLAGADQERTVVELIQPPTGTTPGQRVYLDGDDAKQVQEWPADEVVNPRKKKNAWLNIAEFLKTDENSFATFKGRKMRVQGGFLKGSPKVANGNVS